MYLIMAWIHPAQPGINPDRVHQALERGASNPGSVGHVYVEERDDWWLIGIFINGTRSVINGWNAESVRTALVALLADENSTVLIEMPESNDSVARHILGPGLGWGD
jgi:hypothetical protein